MEGTQEGQTSYLSGDVLVECVPLMPVSLTAIRGPGTVCKGAQREPERVEPPGPPQSQEGSQPYSPSRNQIQFTCHCAHVKRRTRIQLPVLQPTNARLTPGRGTAFLKNLGDRCKRHAARIGTVSVTNAVTSTRTSADTRVGAIEHPQTPHPRILMAWVASPLRETQTRP